MLAEDPEIARTRDGGRLRVGQVDLLCLLFAGRLVFEDDVERRRIEAGQREVEVEFALEVEFGEIDDLEPQQLLVPVRQLRDAVVGEPVGADLGVCQVLEPDCRHGRETEAFRCLIAAVPGDDRIVPVDQHRVHETVLADRPGDDLDLLVVVAAGIAGVGLERFSGN